MTMDSPWPCSTTWRQRGGPVHTWDGELYFNAHRGTYTTQAAVKKNNRRSEFALHEMEVWGCPGRRKGHAYPAAEAERLWKVLLLHQFHDILPGSSIAQVYVEANQAHQALQQEANGLAAAARSALVTPGEGVTVFNALGFDRTEVVDLPAGFDGAWLPLRANPCLWPRARPWSRCPPWARLPCAPPLPPPPRPWPGGAGRRRLPAHRR